MPERSADGPLFLPVDRAFSMKGFGTVVTGTLLSGQIAEGDEAALLPPSPGVGALRVRSIQVHGAATPRALAGQRTAVNLPGVEPALENRDVARVGRPDQRKPLIPGGHPVGERLHRRLDCRINGERLGAPDAGVDMTTSEPLQLTMKKMNRIMDEMEKILAKQKK